MDYWSKIISFHIEGGMDVKSSRHDPGVFHLTTREPRIPVAHLRFVPQRGDIHPPAQVYHWQEYHLHPSPRVGYSLCWSQAVRVKPTTTGAVPQDQ